MSLQMGFDEKITIFPSLNVSYSLFHSMHDEGNGIAVQQNNALSCLMAFPPPLQSRF